MVPMLPALHECLIEHRAGWPYAPEGPAFGTRTGRRNTPDNLLQRIVTPAYREANVILADWGRSRSRT